MSLPNPLLLIGATGSPYTRKMVALLRYRRIPYSIIWGDPSKVLGEMGIEKPKPGLLPTFLLPNKDKELVAITDSTPIIRRLEEEYNKRSVIPTDSALAFINYLLEDFGDEWCTKYMFHYRWHAKEDADNAFDAATCIGCGACVATCKNASAMLYVSAKVSQFSYLPQGKVEAKERVLNMVKQMDDEGFGNCTNTGACEVECPKGISIKNIAKMNREFYKAKI